jgi:hypothetical protein
MINYDGKKFRPLCNSENGETSEDTLFEYQQIGNIVTSIYFGGKIKYGHLIGIVDEDGKINIRYHQVNENAELMTGTCQSTPEIMSSGKIRLHESWQWTSGDHSMGRSIIEEQ